MTVHVIIKDTHERKSVDTSCIKKYMGQGNTFKNIDETVEYTEEQIQTFIDDDTPNGTFTINGQTGEVTVNQYDI